MDLAVRGYSLRDVVWYRALGVKLGCTASAAQWEGVRFDSSSPGLNPLFPWVSWGRGRGEGERGGGERGSRSNLHDHDHESLTLPRHFFVCYFFKIILM